MTDRLPTDIPVFSFAGFSNSGKTTLLCKVVSALTEQGLRIATIKHDGHQFSIDHEGKDTWKHRQAGAEFVAIISDDKTAMIDYRRQEKEKQLLDVLQYIKDVDLILIEGYKMWPIPKIFVIRNRAQIEEMRAIPMIEGIATDFPLEEQSLPVYDINDVQTICRYIVKRFAFKIEM